MVSRLWPGAGAMLLALQLGWSGQLVVSICHRAESEAREEPVNEGC